MYCGSVTDCRYFSMVPGRVDKGGGGGGGGIISPDMDSTSSVENKIIIK